MRLQKLSFISEEWELTDLDLSEVNLIVAKNATGKSRTLHVFDLLVGIITQRGSFADGGGYWETTFQNCSGDILHYSFSKSFINDTLGSQVSNEKLTINDVPVFERRQNAAWIVNKLTGEKEDVFPPANKLVLHTNRDVKKFPFFEEITDWTEHAYGGKFANIIASSNLNRTFFNVLNPLEDITRLYRYLEKASSEGVRNALNSTGYNVEHISSHYSGEEITLYIKEQAIDKALPHWQLAQGLFRSLYILIFLEYLLDKKLPAIIVIDDLCEGLDYERAKKLGKIIFDKCRESNIQLVATSNDVFLMEVVDIKYWNILSRKGKTVSALNYKNSKKVFDDFRFTGLSNFDFFSSDFLMQETGD